MNDKNSDYENLDGLRVVIDSKLKVASIILDRPPYNVVSMLQREHLSSVFKKLDNDKNVKIIVVKGEGKNFSSGGNVQGFMDSTPEKVSQLANNIKAPEMCSKPVVASVRGYCFGVGFELCLACDFRIVSDTTNFALPEQKIGMIPGSGGSIRLLHMIGMTRTKDIVMRSRWISGKEAENWGIATRCVEDNLLEESTNELIEELLNFSPLAQRTIKSVLRTAQDTTLQAGIELEGQAYGRLRSSNDFAAGVKAFNEKKKAEWSGS
jgi:2-oxoglutaroyl-CoA hydrolase